MSVADIATLLEAGATLIWPLMAAIALATSYPLLRDVVRRQSFSIKIGAFELSGQQAADQLGRQIEDLQKAVAVLEARTAPEATRSDPFEDAPPAGRTRIFGTSVGVITQHRKLSILWVDDRPENNAFESAALRNDGHSVTLAQSTAEALSLIGRGALPDLIVSDMGRLEDGVYVFDAGLRLLRDIRAAGDPVAVAFMTSERGVRVHGAEALSLGAALITSSFVELHGLILKLTTIPEPI